MTLARSCGQCVVTDQELTFNEISKNKKRCYHSARIVKRNQWGFKLHITFAIEIERRSVSLTSSQYSLSNFKEQFILWLSTALKMRFSIQDFLRSDSHLPKKYVLFASVKALKNDENAFYFILKALFVFKIVSFFVLTFWSYRKSGLIKKITLISKFMSSQMTNNYSTHIGQTMKSEKEPNNEATRQWNLAS